MSKGNSLRDVMTDLEWKRTYLHELEKKRRRQEGAVADTDGELTKVRKEIVELEKRLEKSRRETH